MASNALPGGYTRRPASSDDIEVLAALWRRSDESLGVQPEPAGSVLGWILELPVVQHDRDTVVIEHDANPVGLGVAMRDAASIGSWLHWFGLVDPAHRGRSLGSWLVSWADAVVEQRASERPFDVRTACPAVDDDAHRLFESSGYEQVRISWDMAIVFTGGEPSVGDLPEGVLLRAFEAGRDERTLWEVEESAFEGHFGFAPSPYESFDAEWYQSSDWDPSRALLAEVDGVVVGELAWVDAASDGYIYNLGVLKEHRRRGIATALLRTAFAHIAAAKYERATLSVDTGNESGAVELYRALGMEPIRESHVFQRARRVSLPDGYQLRPATIANDLDAAVAILRACDLHDVGFADDVSDWIREDWVGSSHRGAWMVDDPSGDPCAFANLGATNPSSTIDTFCPVLPQHRDAVRPALVEHLQREARSIAIGSPTLLLNFSSTEGAAPVAEAAGFAFARTFWHMHRLVDVTFRASSPPTGVTIRAYEVGADDRLGWELIQDSFAGHFGIEPMSFEEYQHDVIDSDMWDPALASIGLLDGSPVGIVTGYVLGDVGWVGDLGVVASGRGRGIGRALLERAFEVLASQGVSHLQLNVDSANETGATRLYEAAGMTVRRAFHCYEKVLTPG